MSWERADLQPSSSETSMHELPSGFSPSLVLSMGWFPDDAGGLTRYVRGLTEALAADGRGRPEVVAVGPVTDAPDFVHQASSVARPLPWRLCRYALEVRRRSAGARLVDAHFALYAWPCLKVPRVRRLPLVFHFHGPWAAEFLANGEPPGLRNRLRRWLEAAVYRRVDVFVTLSHAFKAILVTEFGVPPARIHVLGGGVELDHFTPGDRAAARAVLGMDPSCWSAVSVRRLDPRMGLDVLLRAWAEVPLANRLLLIAGEGPARGDLEALAAQLNLHHCVRFLGRVTEEALVHCYRSADVAIVPSRALEGFGLVVLEALACGTPVIAADVGGLAETLVDLDPGLIVPPEDPTALAERLTDAVEGVRPLPSSTVCRTFAERFSWDAVADRHRAVYDDLIDARTP